MSVLPFSAEELPKTAVKPGRDNSLTGLRNESASVDFFSFCSRHHLAGRNVFITILHDRAIYQDVQVNKMVFSIYA